MADKWNLIIDIDRCNGCYNCALATKDEYVGNSEPGYFAPQPRHGHNWVEVRQKERGEYPALDVSYMPVMCNHCDDAPCLKASSNGAVTKRDDGIVVIDPDKARGQKAIVDACPYGAVFWNEDLQIPQHWPFDAHLLDRGWAAPRCVEVCATGAITAVKTSDDAMRKIVREEKLAVRRPELATRPRVYYKNLDRAETEFIAGTVVSAAGGTTECAVGARVSLFRNAMHERETTCDVFGDFRFDRLTPGSGSYCIAATLENLSASVDVSRLDRSIYVGRISLASSQRS